MSVCEKKFEVKFDNGDSVTLGFDLTEAAAFDYGNGTAVRVTGDGWPVTVDTRYDDSIDRDAANFGGWCRRWIQRNYDGVAMIEEIQV